MKSLETKMETIYLLKKMVRLKTTSTKLGNKYVIKKRVIQKKSENKFFKKSRQRNLE